MVIVFRADASVSIGTGHVMRCITLADELKRCGHQCHFVTRSFPGHLAAVIKARGHQVLLLPEPTATSLDASNRPTTAHAAWLGVSWEQDAEETLNGIGSLKADWLVVDHYAIDDHWERRVAVAAEHIMAIDDLADRMHYCTLLLDQNLGRSVSDYDQLVPDTCTRLIGPYYALLRPEFTELREMSLKRRTDQKFRRILVSMGGVDQSNVTGKVLSALSKCALPEDTQVDIIMGSRAPWLREVQLQSEQLPFVSTVSIDVSNMAERMYWSDLSIGAAGSTSWERCCLGVPAIVVVLAENQMLIARALESAGAAIIVKEADIFRQIDRSIKSFLDRAGRLAEMTKLAACITDGEGCSRVASRLRGDVIF